MQIMLGPIALERLSSASVKGIYNGRMPSRALWLQPDALIAFLIIAPFVVVSDIYRAGSASLQAMLIKAGVQPPSYSRHGYGRAIDIDVQATMLLLGFKTKAELDAWMAARGWYCHRTDHLMASECWHYNYFVGGAAPVLLSGETVTSHAGERELMSLFGAFLRPSSLECQRMLTGLGFYHGALDAETDPKWYGPIMRAAVSAFQRAWIQPCKVQAWQMECANQFFGPITRRTLAFIAAGTPPVLP